MVLLINYQRQQIYFDALFQYNIQLYHVCRN